MHTSVRYADVANVSYRPLGNDEKIFFLHRQWRAPGKTLDPDDFTEAAQSTRVIGIT